MSATPATAPLSEATSLAVQTHLQLLQGVIARMGNNSAACKTWCVTIVSAVMVVAAEKTLPALTYLAFLPICVFLLLDAQYLALEKGFRDSYATFVRRLHEDNLRPADLYEIRTSAGGFNRLLDALTSFSILLFYPPLALLALVVRWTIGS